MWFSWLLCNYMGHTSLHSRTIFPPSFFKKQKSMRFVVLSRHTESNLLGGFFPELSCQFLKVRLHCWYGPVVHLFPFRVHRSETSLFPIKYVPRIVVVSLHSNFWPFWPREHSILDIMWTLLPFYVPSRKKRGTLGLRLFPLALARFWCNTVAWNFSPSLAAAHKTRKKNLADQRCDPSTLWSAWDPTKSRESCSRLFYGDTQTQNGAFLVDDFLEPPLLCQHQEQKKNQVGVQKVEKPQKGRIFLSLCFL